MLGDNFIYCSYSGGLLVRGEYIVNHENFYFKDIVNDNIRDSRFLNLLFIVCNIEESGIKIKIKNMEFCNRFRGFSYREF